MKALKEKRIGLRSLLRRGLVILSLFALVFASCDSSGDEEDNGGGGTPPPPPPPPVYKPGSIKIISWPTNDSYEGMPLDLTGLEVRVSYEDQYGATYNHYDILTPTPGTFSTDPPYAVGVLAEGEIDSDDVIIWAPQLQYDLLWYSADAKKTFSIPLDLQSPESLAAAKNAKKDPPTVQPVVRATKWTKLSEEGRPLTLPYSEGAENNLEWSKGLNFTGDFGRTAYVDDVPRFSGFKLQPEYLDGSKKEITIEPDIDWRIVPEYWYYDTDTKKENPYGAQGDLFITVGKNPFIYKTAEHPYVKDAIEKETARLAAHVPPIVFAPNGESGIIAENGSDPGLTVRHPYDEIFIVKGIEVIQDPELKPFFYWEDDGPAAWLNRLLASKTAKFRVSYTGASTPREYTPKELDALNKVWYNKLFNKAVEGAFGSDDPFAVRGVYDSSTSKDGKVSYAKNKDPNITVGYRGRYATIKTPVYTRVTNLSIEILGGGDNVPVSMRGRDNDSGTMNARTFDSLVKVTATFSASYDTTDQKTLELHFDANGEGADTVTGYSYESSVGTPVNVPGNGDKGAVLEGEKYSSNFYDISHNSKNNGKVVNVRLFYAQPEFNVVTGEVSEDDVKRVGVATRRVYQTVPVLWSDIPNTNDPADLTDD